jgi:hypothetical protein
MVEIAKQVREIDSPATSEVAAIVADLDAPAVFRGLVADWPLVEAARRSDEAVRDCLLGHYEGAPVTVFTGPPEARGRIFYTDDLAEKNFEQNKAGMDTVLERLLEHAGDEPAPVIYMGSMALDYCLPGMRATHSIPFPDQDVTVRIWIANRTRVAAHYDVLDNVACVVAGRRRFTVFPPDQLENLYVGPLDFTPAGQPISLVDLDDPDFERFPRFAEALRHAEVAELEPGDALFVPAMWWHHVRGLDSVNILINHWWRDAPAYMGAPADALLHAILNIRDLPAAQRRAWQGIFQHYVFDYDERTVAHVPAARRGVTGKLDDDSARRLRALLRNNLNR